jgi:hypothetical protein
MGFNLSIPAIFPFQAFSVLPGRVQLMAAIIVRNNPNRLFAAVPILKNQKIICHQLLDKQGDIGSWSERYVAEPGQVGDDKGNGTGNDRGEEPGQKNPFQRAEADRVDSFDNADAQNRTNGGLGT